MNRTTLLAVLGFLVLLAVVLVINYWPKEKPPEGFHLAGWSTHPDDQKPEAAGAALAFGDEKGAKVEESPIDGIDIGRGGETVALRKAAGGDGKTWNVTAPLEAPADWNRIRPILERFKTPTDSVFSKRVKPEDLPVYGLDPSQRIELKLLKGGKPWLHLVIGAKEVNRDDAAEGGPPQTDTFVQRGGDDLVYRVSGKDLRSAVDVKLSDLRSKKIFTFEKDAVGELVLENPGDAAHPRVHLKRNATAAAPEPAAGDEAATDDGKPKVADEWTLVEPTGFLAGPQNGFLGTLTSAYATAFIGPKDADYETAKAALGEKPYRLSVVLPNETVRIAIGEPGDQHGYLQVEGRNEIIKVSKFTATNLRKGLGDVREKKVLAFPKDAITRIQIEQGPDTIGLERTGATWQATAPAGLVVGEKPIATLLADITTFAVAEFAGPLPETETGLASPTHRLSVTAGSETRTLRFGKEVDGKVYGQVEGSPEVFRVTAYLAKKFQKKAEDLRDMQIFSLAREELIELTLRHADESVTLTRDPDDVSKWTVTAPKAVAAPMAGVVTGIVNTVTSLTAKKLHPGRTPQAVGLGDQAAFTLVAKLKDGAEHVLRVSDQLDEQDPFAETDDAKWRGTVFSLNAYQVKNLRKRLKDFEERP